MKKVIIFLIVGFCILISIILGIFLINRNNTKDFDMSTKKQLANNLEKNENIQMVTTIANQNVISPNDLSLDEKIYIIKENEGYIVVYQLDENGKEILIKNTGIVTSYLPEADILELKNGIKVMGKEKLNARLEDYE